MSTIIANIQTFLERHGWKILLVITLIFGLFGIGDMLQGMDADPAIAEGISGMDWEDIQASDPELANLIDQQARAGGAHLLIVSILGTVIILKGYRHGEAWAWYTLWALPLWTVLVFIMFLLVDRPSGAPTPPPMISAPIFFALLVLTLLFSYRKFFPNAQMA
jgi:hypothetical protein